jgi:hypothetical protein
MEAAAYIRAGGSGKLTFTEMFKILVDGIEHSRYKQTFRGCITVGSGADAQVRLDRGAPLSLEIRPMTGSDKGCFAVTVHEPEGITHHTREWWRERKHVDVRYDPAQEFRLRGGDSQESMTVCGYKIEVITGCATCGKESTEMWDCTCGDRRT